MYGKILGGLLGGAIGDAMGAATETRSTDQIIERFGGPVTEFLTPPDDVFARGFEAGAVTDDFSLAYCTAKAIVAHGGEVDASTARDALLNWSETRYFCLAGPTTVGAVKKLRGEEVPDSKNAFLTVDNSKGSNGSAMKIAPVGLCSKGDVKKAIRDAITICMPTHGNSTALAGGCAVAAAVSAALHDGATADEVIRAGLAGTEQGDAWGKRIGKELACPSVYKRILLAVEIAKRFDGDMDRTMRELADIIGTGLSAAEAVPSAFGLFYAAKGDPMKTIIAGVNIGNDTDTVATIAGAIAGTYAGTNGEMERYLETLDRVNGYDLRALAREIEAL